MNQLILDHKRADLLLRISSRQETTRGGCLRAHDPSQAVETSTRHFVVEMMSFQIEQGLWEVQASDASGCRLSEEDCWEAERWELRAVPSLMASEAVL